VRRRGRKRTGEEVSNWWFSDEELAIAISNIVDVPPPPKKPRKRVPRKPPDNSEQVEEVT